MAVTPTASFTAIILPLGDLPSAATNDEGQIAPPPDDVGRIASAE